MWLPSSGSGCKPSSYLSFPQEELKNPFVTKVAEQTKTDNEKNYKIACFGLKAFRHTCPH